MSTSIDNLILAKLYELDVKLERLEDSVERSLIKQEKVLNERIRQLNALAIRHNKRIETLKRMLRLERKTSREFYVKNPPECSQQTKLKEALRKDQLNKLALDGFKDALEQSKARDAMHKET